MGRLLKGTGLLLAPCLIAFVGGCSADDDDAAPDDDGLFQPGVDYTVAPNPNAVVAGDFDGDGALDLAVSSSNDAGGIGEVDILIGRGDGTFDAGEVVGVVVPRSMAAGDLDGDGDVDVAVVSFDGQGPLGISLLLSNGDGSFEREVLGGRDWSGWVTTGDVNGDGQLDLGAPWLDVGSGDMPVGIDIMLGPDFSQAYAVESDARQMALGDFDGDGFDDLLTDDGVWISDGSGGFATPTPFSSALLEDEQPAQMGTADLNADGALDALFTVHEFWGSAAPVVSVALGDGSAQLSDASRFAVNAHPGAFQVADLDGDGHLDIAVGCDNQNLQYESAMVGILFGDGNGQFPRTGGAYVSMGCASGLVTADLDGDGAVDLVGTNTSGDSVTVLLGKP